MNSASAWSKFMNVAGDTIKPLAQRRWSCVCWESNTRWSYGRRIRLDILMEENQWGGGLPDSHFVEDGSSLPRALELLPWARSLPFFNCSGKQKSSYGLRLQETVHIMDWCSYDCIPGWSGLRYHETVHMHGSIQLRLSHSRSGLRCYETVHMDRCSYDCIPAGADYYLLLLFIFCRISEGFDFDCGNVDTYRM